jgi:hypothetical protein
MTALRRELEDLRAQVEVLKRRRKERREDRDGADLLAGLALYTCVNLCSAGFGDRLAEFAPPEVFVPAREWQAACEFALRGFGPDEQPPPLATAICEADLAILRSDSSSMMERLAASFGDLPPDALPAQPLRDLRRRMLLLRKPAASAPAGADAGEGEGVPQGSPSRGIVRRVGDAVRGMLQPAPAAEAEAEPETPAEEAAARATLAEVMAERYREVESVVAADRRLSRWERYFED